MYISLFLFNRYPLHDKMTGTIEQTTPYYVKNVSLDNMDRSEDGWRKDHELNLYLPPVILAVGCIGNLVTFAVYFRKSMRQSVASVYLRFLAIIDIYVLFAWLTRPMIQSFHDTDISIFSTGMCKIVLFSEVYSAELSGWTLSLVAIERVIGIRSPSKHLKYFTKKRAIISMIAIFFIFFWLCSTSLFIYNISTRVNVDNTTYNICFRPQVSMTNYYAWRGLDIAIYFVIPFVIITVCNIGIIYYLKVHRPVDSQKMHSITVSLVAISAVFLITYCIHTTILSVWEIHGLESGNILTIVVNYLLPINSAINFLLYSVISSKFRKELYTMCFGGCIDLKEHSIKTESHGDVQLTSLETGHSMTS